MEEMLDFPMEEEMKNRIQDAVDTLSMFSTGILTAVGFVTHPSMKSALESLLTVTKAMNAFLTKVEDTEPTQAQGYEFFFILTENLPNVRKTDSILTKLGIAILTDNGETISDHLANICKG